MSEPNYFVSAAALRNLKRTAQLGVEGVPSAHLTEGIASALGFRTHAALRAALSGRSTAPATKPSNAILVQRLRQLGHAVPEDLKLLPELTHSYTPFQRFPLRTKRSVRWRAWRNLMVSAVNAGLSQRLFGLSPGENWWPGGAEHSQQCKRFTYSFTFEQGLPAIASVDCQAGDELSIAVVLLPKKHVSQPDSYDCLREGAATAHGWVERRLGAWVQDGGECFHCRRDMQSRVADLVISPSGYADQGSFIM